MLCYPHWGRHVCFGINGPITAQLSNGPWQRSGIAWSHLLLSFTLPYINLPITEGENCVAPVNDVMNDGRILLSCFDIFSRGVLWRQVLLIQSCWWNGTRIINIGVMCFCQDEMYRILPVQASSIGFQSTLSCILYFTKKRPAFQ